MKYIVFKPKAKANNYFQTTIYRRHQVIQRFCAYSIKLSMQIHALLRN